MILKNLVINGKEILPLVEGGKGIYATNGESAGAWAACGGIGTISAVYSDIIRNHITISKGIDGFSGATRADRSQQLADHSIEATISQVKIARERSNGNGLININILWELAKTKEILHGVLSKVGDLIHGVTCGAGIPYQLGEIAAKYKVMFYPIVSSAKVFEVLWKRAYKKYKDYLGAVVYENPWRSGGHLGISNREDPNNPEDSLGRVRKLRETMNDLDLKHIPIILAGGVWNLKEFEKDWINDPFMNPIMFQFGTRPLLTQESPISEEWKQQLFDLKQGDIKINKFSPTGFYSSAVNNDFLQDLQGISDRQVVYSKEINEEFNTPYKNIRRTIYIRESDLEKVTSWIESGHDKMLYTPDSTIVFVNSEKAKQIKEDQINCVGCLSRCRFSNWDNEAGTSGEKPDPRSFCIYKTLHNVSHGDSVDNNLMFGGDNAYRFAGDPLYKKNGNKYIPTVKELIDAIKSGN
ncbi:NAD(P)H-dependent flavin oxidoreductase [Candidatus Nesciobacter abundans]|uniref:Nitronate monooxygenase n=1 Tax=Candidatus Nesciobacter abundans TaxID=2601668 RepID=A0A5C0UGM9_9PROT|nr:nitronate monooxygenase [Candidatus Nesciobacter abundans]QEK39276.1 nitronate monooxygenase [Candidatus Nesciobacter abundans]